MIATTYKQIAEQEKLEPATAARFVKYMQIRWPDTESDKCRDGYAREWAYRFAHGYEYAASDLQGRAILDSLTPTPEAV